MLIFAPNNCLLLKALKDNSLLIVFTIQIKLLSIKNRNLKNKMSKKLRLLFNWPQVYVMTI